MLIEKDQLFLNEMEVATIIVNSYFAYMLPPLTLHQRPKYVKVFKSGPSEICGRETFKNLT